MLLIMLVIRAVSYPSKFESLKDEEWCVRMYECLVYIIHFIFPIADVCCSSTFWWKMEFLFASLSQEDESFLKQQVRTVIFCFTANIIRSQFH